jgi:hypothetical protein
MSALHRNGVIPRPMIQALLGAIVAPQPPVKLMDGLTAEPLAEPANQPESITVSQMPLDIDMSTKLWSALHSPIRPCAFYMVTTVFLDTGEPYPAPKTVTEVHIAGRPTADPDADPSRDEVITSTVPLP